MRGTQKAAEDEAKLLTGLGERCGEDQWENRMEMRTVGEGSGRAGPQLQHAPPAGGEEESSPGGLGLEPVRRHQCAHTLQWISASCLRKLLPRSPLH